MYSVPLIYIYIHVKHKQTDGRADGETNGRADRWSAKQTHGQTCTYAQRRTEKHNIDRQYVRQTSKQTDIRHAEVKKRVESILKHF